MGVETAVGLGAAALSGRKKGGGGGYDDFARPLYWKTQAARTGLADRAAAFFDNPDPTMSPQFGALKDAMNTQYGQATDALLSRIPRGGALAGALAQLEGQKASAMTQGIGQLTENELNRAMQVGNMGLSLMVPAMNIQAQQAEAEAQRNAQAKQGLGYGIGGLIGGPQTSFSSLGQKGGRTPMQFQGMGMDI